MIIRVTPASQLLITQPDHAALAADIMRRWRADGLLRAARRDSILLAVEQHDNGWEEVDAAPLVENGSGRLLDFVATLDPVKQSVWPRGVERLAAAPHAAALVAQHGLHIYRRYREMPDWADFFSGLERARDRHLERLGVTSRELLGEYFFVRVGDLASLTFCNGWTEPQSDDAGSGYVVRLSGTRLTIAPDPFEGAEFPIEVAARELPAVPFRSAEEARQAFAAAPAVVIRGSVAGSSG